MTTVCLSNTRGLMTAFYGRVHGFGPWQHAREAINKAIDASAVHMEMIYAGGGGGRQRMRWWSPWPPCTARLNGARSKKTGDQLVVAVRSLSAACRSTKPLHLLAAINCARRSGEGGLSAASQTFGPAAPSHRSNELLLQPISAA